MMITTKPQLNQFCELALDVISIETQAIAELKDRIGENFTRACELLLHCQGRIVVTGMGKSGHIGRKIAATLASTGTPAFFVHPGEANHGDLGMITAKDVVISISNSGETPEILSLLPVIKRIGAQMISLSGKPTSTLARFATVNLDVSVKKEACPLGLAPSASTTATLVMGDALAIALLGARGFTSNDFAQFHPGGALGRRLLLRIADIMHTGTEIPSVHEGCSIAQALIEMSQKSFGITTVVDSNGTLRGIYTDGDLRRTLDHGHDVHHTQIKTVMTENPVTIPPSLLAAEALKVMQDSKITSILVVDESQHPIGVVHLHDLLRAGVI